MKETPAEKTERKLTPVLAVRMSPEIAKAIRGKLEASIPLPDEGPAPIVGDRLFLREWIGAPTGRADLVKVIAVEGSALRIERPWGWGSCKTDDDLSSLGFAVIPERFPKIGFV